MLSPLAPAAILMLLAAAPSAGVRARGTPARPARTAVFDYGKRLDANQIGMFVTNFGAWAYDVSTGNPGLEFPRGSGNTAVFAAGLWIGAKVAGAPRVTVSEYASEYAPGVLIAGAPDDPSRADYHVYELRRAYASPATRDSALGAWTAGAVPRGAPAVEVMGDGTLSLRCDQLLWSVFNDGDPGLHGTQPGGTPPLGIEVRQSAFAYDLPGALGNTVFLEFWIHNRGFNTLDSAHVSLWADPDVGDFVDDLAGCDTTLDMAYAYNASNDDAVYGSEPPAVGFALLRGPVKPSGDTLRLTASAGYPIAQHPVSAGESWNYMRGLAADGGAIVNPVTTQPTRFMFTGDPVAGTGWLDANGGDRLLLMTSGPFSLASGDSVKVLAAIVVAQGANRLASVSLLRAHAAEVRSFAAARNDSLTPALVSLASATAQPGLVQIEWSALPGTVLRARVERRAPGADWGARGEIAADGRGALVFEDRDVLPGARYGYRLAIPAPGGGDTRTGEVWVDVPASPALALEGLRPNPAAGDARVAFTLADDSPATLELLDVGGRRLLAREVGALGAGRHVMALEAGRPLAPGLWFLRLTQGGRSVTARAAVVR
jgi:hypothetical protein